MSQSSIRATQTEIDKATNAIRPFVLCRSAIEAKALPWIRSLMQGLTEVILSPDVPAEVYTGSGTKLRLRSLGDDALGLEQLDGKRLLAVSATTLAEELARAASEWQVATAKALPSETSRIAFEAQVADLKGLSSLRRVVKGFGGDPLRLPALIDQNALTACDGPLEVYKLITGEELPLPNAKKMKALGPQLFGSGPEIASTLAPLSAAQQMLVHARAALAPIVYVATFDTRVRIVRGSAREVILFEDYLLPGERDIAFHPKLAHERLTAALTLSIQLRGALAFSYGRLAEL